MGATLEVKPELDNWEFNCYYADGVESYKNLVSTLKNFLNTTNMRAVKIPVNCFLVGNIYGDKRFKDGQEIHTTDVQFVTKYRYTDALDEYDVMCAFTEAGSSYYLGKPKRN